MHFGNFSWVILMSVFIFFVSVLYLSSFLSSTRSEANNVQSLSIPGKIIHIPISFGGTISVRVLGNPSNIPVICLPGINSKLVDEWTVVGEEMSQQGYVIYILNFHSNPKTVPSLIMGGISNSDVAKVINEVMSHIQAQEIILMGKSWGGGQAMNYAKEFPNKVKKLCLVAPASSNPSTIKQLEQNPAPVYLAWAKDDSTIWYSNSESWKQLLGSKLTFQSAERGGHRILSEYAHSMIKFLQEK
jgi:pimeloyl-ACP methyl ester carboxylesterase